MKTIGKTIADARKASGWSLRQLARFVEVSPALLCRIETGTHEPQRYLIVKLAGFLGGDADLWCAIAGRITPALEDLLALVALKDPKGYRREIKKVSRRLRA